MMLLVKGPVVSPSLVWLLLMVGLADVLQQLGRLEFNQRAVARQLVNLARFVA